MPIFYDRIADQVEELLPELYQKDGPRLVSFLKSYFEFLEKGQLVYKEAADIDYIGLEDGTTAGEAFNSAGERGNLLQEPGTYAPSSIPSAKINYEIDIDTGGAQKTSFEVGEYIVGSSTGAVGRIDVIGSSSNLYIEQFSETQFDIDETIVGKSSGMQAKVDTFKDYFYYSAKHIDDILDIKQFDCTDTTIYTSLHEEEVYKIGYTSIKMRNQIAREHPGRIFESDMSPEFNFVVDKNIEWSDKRNILYFDIETWFDPENPKDNMPEKAKMPITSIQCYSPDQDKYYVFSWHPEHTKDFDEPKIIDDGKYVFMLCKEEESAILGFINTLNMLKIDIISGWYSAGYDLPYIVNRCKVLGLPYENLSPIKDVYIRKRGEYWKVNIKGLDHIDMLEGVQDMGYNLL